MSKVTSKIQVTIPRYLARQYSIRPGDSISFRAAGDLICVVPPTVTPPTRLNKRQRLALFDAGTQRQRAREAVATRAAARERGWTREELYEHGSPD